MDLGNENPQYEKLDNLDFLKRNGTDVLPLTLQNLQNFQNGARVPIFLDLNELNSLDDPEQDQTFAQRLAWQSVLSGIGRSLNTNDHLYNPHLEKHLAQAKSIYEFLITVNPQELNVYVNESDDYSSWPRLVIETSEPIYVNKSEVPISVARGLHDFTSEHIHTTTTILNAIKLHDMDVFDLIAYLATINYPENLIQNPNIKSHLYHKGGKRYEQLNWSAIAYDMKLPLPTCQKGQLMQTNGFSSLFKEIKTYIRPKDHLGLEDVPILPVNLIKTLANLRQSYWCQLFNGKEYDPQIINATLMQTPRVVLPTIYEWYTKKNREDKKMAELMMSKYPDLFINLPATSYLDTSIKLTSKAAKSVLLRYNEPMQNCNNACETCALNGIC